MMFEKKKTIREKIEEKVLAAALLGVGKFV